MCRFVIYVVGLSHPCLAKGGFYQTKRECNLLNRLPPAKKPSKSATCLLLYIYIRQVCVALWVINCSSRRNF